MKMFDPNDPKLVDAIFEALWMALNSVTFDIQCLDWFNYKHK